MHKQTKDFFRDFFFSFSESKSEMVITWSTMSRTNESIVEYKSISNELRAKGISKIFVDGGKKKHQQFIHKVQFWILHGFNVISDLFFYLVSGNAPGLAAKHPLQLPLWK